jgi:protein-S-isoprenylcysteine O-methyltransferase Ste14
MRNKIPPPVLLLICGAAMWYIAGTGFAYAIAIPYALVVSIALAAVGVLSVALAMRRFRVAETTINPNRPDTASALVQTGIFARTRNPMYLGLLFILTGWAVWLQSLSNLGMLAVFVVLLTELQIKPEEAALRKLFGANYDGYCQRVGRWF